MNERFFLPLDNRIITFIGGGNMATALIGGLIASGVPPALIRVGEPDADRRAALQRDYGIHAQADNVAAIDGADVVVFAVKPQVLPDIARSAAAAIAVGRPLVMSIAAGVTTSALSGWLGGDVAMVRAMPNTPALIGKGAAGLYANAAVSAAGRNTATAIMEAAGDVIWIDDEDLMDAVTAVSGSGPAYFFLVIELMEQAAVELGLEPADARRLVTQTALGAASMAKAGDVDAAELRRRVTSPGGTTAAALAVFEEGGIGNLVTRALRAARDRGRELSGKE
ncbi:MAG TPA: pyrroline-5-carboxylate reductase [Gammaproteobacteria bacterium]|nr:pyrroline-5-carboxylate reductase [Gammaproteobacteria bacterium]